MKEDKPKIRFKGFTDAWKQRKLKELVNEIGTGKSKYNLDIHSIKYPVLGSRGIIGYENNYDYDGDFLLTARVGEYAGTLYKYRGMVKITDNTVFLKSNRTDFLYYLLNNYDLKKLSFGSGQPLVKSSELKELNLYIAPNINEENKISKIFNNLDNLITLHQRKLDKLLNVKKALLEKMFPKNGGDIPEIRFKGFTDTWKQRKVTDIGKISIGLVTTMTKHYTDSGTLLIRNSDIKDNKFEFSDNPIYLDNEFAEQNKTRQHQIGDVVTVHTGDVGTSAVITEKEANSIGFATIITRPNRNVITPEYLSVFLNTEKHKKWAIAISTGDGRTNYNLGDYYKLEIPVPNIKEQDKISNFILKLDNLITLHQRKLDKLKNIKKSLLEKMFV